MHFSEEQIKEIENELAKIRGKYQSILVRYTYRTYTSERGKEYAIHGFARRLKLLFRSIINVFDILPPDLMTIPTSDDVSDAVINIQAFVFNVFGCADNLAWIWVHEKGLKRDDGSPFPNGWVGLRKSNVQVRRTFSPEFQSYLVGLDKWFANMENFRHALAHRIPFYIPPHTVSVENVEAYKALDERIAEADRRRDFEESERLSAEQMKLAVFSPIMTHSFSENAKIVIFHAQLIADFNTIEEMGRKMLIELDR